MSAGTNSPSSVAASNANTANPANPANTDSLQGPVTPKPPTAEAQSDPRLAKLAANQPDYSPAACNVPDPAPGHAVCFALQATTKVRSLIAGADGPPATALGPAQIKAAYHLPDGGQGQTVAIVDAFGASTVEADLAVFRQHYGLPACTSANGCFRKTDQTGGADYPADDKGWAEETSLDVDAVSSACPQCRILLVEAASAATSDLGTAEKTAVSLGAKYVSNSYGIPGEFAGEQADTDYDHPGVAIVASSGDTGNVVNWPASDPDVVGVGGTTLTADSSTTRGWTETAWTSGGSGCSAYEPQPAYQAGLTTDCAKRATADISAVADPQTGLAVYDTLGQPGWVQVGGTSLSAPLITAMYALAGAPAAGTYPVTYPYAFGGNHLFDVTQGSDGSCGNVLCTAGSGWDGPTGMGTPNGVTALTLSGFGTATGTLTSSAGGPLPNASVVFTDASQGLTFHATTDAQGRFTVQVAHGTYSATASAYGFKPATRAGVQITDNQTTTVDLTLSVIASKTVSGKVLDSTGHKWGLYSKITIDGYPYGAIYSNPKTGAYSVSLPEDANYTVHVTPIYPGYGTASQSITVGTADVAQNLAVGADQNLCTAPGYSYPAQADFEGWSGTTGQGGWTVTDNNGATATWEFDDPNGMWNLTTGSGNFGTADPYDHNGAAEDTDFVSPVMDLSAQPDAALKFLHAYLPAAGTVAEVDGSGDGGKTWHQIWNANGGAPQGAVGVPLTGLAGHAGVQVRFHYSGAGLSLWQIDSVYIGTCRTVPGGIVEGTVTDGNTHQPLNGAVTTDTASAATTATSHPTPDDAGTADGFYWLFSQGAGRHTYTTAANRYATQTTTATTKADTVVAHDVTLQAGRLSVGPSSLSVSEELGKKTQREVTLTNTGRAPLHVTLGEQSAGSTAPASGTTAGTTAVPVPLKKVPGNYPTGPAVRSPSTNTATPTLNSTPANQTPAKPAPAIAPVADTGGWQALADYPEQIMDNAVGYYQGRAYSVGGVTQIVGGVARADGFVYDPVGASWTAIAPLPQALESPAAAFLNGTMYVVGGWNVDGKIQSTVYAYHPAGDSWTRVADLPQATTSATAAVLNGSLYVIGGCATGNCATLSSAVYRYSPAADSWTKLADYPVSMQWGACAGIAAEVICAGGDTHDSGGHTEGLASTYLFHPKTDTWTQAADIPYPDWGMSSSGANGQLQIVGGITDADGTNQAEQYDPVNNVWSALPNAVYPTFRSGGTGCGLYQIGGSIADGVAFPTGNDVAQVLPGFDQCGGDAVPWLTTQRDRGSLELAPGQSIRVRVTADASQITAPGRYAGALTFTTDTPYVNDALPVNLHVTVPSSWSEVTGTVTSAATAGSAAKPLPGATVQLCPARDATSGTCTHAQYTVTTDAHGAYSLWLPGRADTMAVVASSTGYASQTKEVMIRRGGVFELDFTLATA
ncbi:carboxypeptidase regulatory-like domain-containing protein [Catenulispora sp. GP43]|uniref:carboxypeptidase regulatory-like domain-containing protein n=1 Tax=Catenulispora sp. GP43 TaxID=3156263 RepID=UPI0035121AD7